MLLALTLLLRGLLLRDLRLRVDRLLLGDFKNNTLGGGDGRAEEGKDDVKEEPVVNGASERQLAVEHERIDQSYKPRVAKTLLKARTAKAATWARTAFFNEITTRPYTTTAVMGARRGLQQR